MGAEAVEWLRQCICGHLLMLAPVTISNLPHYNSVARASTLKACLQAGALGGLNGVDAILAIGKGLAKSISTLVVLVEHPLAAS